VEMDSTIGDHKVDLFVTIKPETPKIAKEKQHIGQVYIFSDYQETAENRKRIPRGIEKFDYKFYIIDTKNKYRKKVVANHFFMTPGMTYDLWDHNQTINHLVNLNAYKFVKNDFVASPDTINHLDVYYYLTPMQRESL